jgi:acetyl/propionyl-CoA carboxylase alpha subunit
MTAKTFKKVLIANRGEIAIRVARAAGDLGIETVAVFSDDDRLSAHLRKADTAKALGRSGPQAYLDIERILQIAVEEGCDALHPGYGFLSENAEFASRVAAAGIAFVGPSSETLALLGDKTAARALASRLGVPVLEGTDSAVTLEEAIAFFDGLGGGAMMIKARAGGGGRGLRAARSLSEIREAYARASSEAKAAFGDGAVYVERLIENARHIEVQIAGDRKGQRVHFWDRECTVQRRNQKLIEVAPSPSLHHRLRDRIIVAALAVASASNYENLGTFEFLVDASKEDGNPSFAFIEANPRLQVEHTVTEEALGVDLVRTQLCIAAGQTLADLGLTQNSVPAPRGFAIQVRVNMETIDAAGGAQPAGGTLLAFDIPSGPGVRVDTFGYTGYRTNASFDPLLAKLIVHSTTSSFKDAAAKAYRSLCEFRIEGVDTNIAFLAAILSHPHFEDNRLTTRFVEDRAKDLAEKAARLDKQLFVQPTAASFDRTPSRALAAPPGTIPISAPMQGLVVSVDVLEGTAVRPGQQIAVLSAMKMEHIVSAAGGGIVRLIAVKAGDVLSKDDAIAFVEPSGGGEAAGTSDEEMDLDRIRPDLAEMLARQALGLDETRPSAVAFRRKAGQRTARENVAAVIDEGSFIEYGSLGIAAQRARRSLDDLIRNTPADGLIAGLGSVNGALFGAEKARCMVLAYDYTVLAGTQGQRNHKKKNRMFKLAEEWRVPVVLFAEGGGGRPGDTERAGLTGLDGPSFLQFAKLSGLVPLVGVVSGRCFAGNAALLGCCDVIIAAKDATIGMGGPAMIEGGGLGRYRPEEVGPVSFQATNGVIDVVVEDEVEAAAVAKKYLSYFQGSLESWTAADQRLLRRAVPENRLRAYDVRSVIHLLADEGTVLELRPAFGIGILTALIRIEGHPFGLIANNPMHLGGAIDSDAADKAARFLQLCDAFDVPIVSLCDTPGFMVGPDAERTALVRHVSRMYVTGASVSVPFFTIVLRKGYGLGAQAMAGGSFHAKCFTVSWPTGEFGGMGLEGAVRLGYRKELEAIADPVEREGFFRKMVDKSYEDGKAISIASVLEIDQVIDPVETRDWIVRGLRAMPAAPAHPARKRPFIDTW